MPALKTVMKTVSKPVNDVIKPIKSTVDPNVLKGKQSIIPGVKTTKHQDTLEIPIKSKFTTKLEQTEELGKAHVDQLKFALTHPIIATVTSKAGQKSIRGTASIIDDALRPVGVRTVQTTTGNKVFAGFERGESSGKLTEKADNFIAIKQAEKDAIKSTGSGSRR